MREIKFRAWQKSTQSIRQVLVIDYLNNMIDLVGGEIEQYFEDVELMQYTGLKDKNDTEIYEGDTVRYVDGECSYTGVVEVDCYTFYINGVGPLDSFDFLDVSNTFDGTTSLTIIGNIYENSVLLEVEK
ncbi:YopX family protein [Enterococcus alishanensis]